MDQVSKDRKALFENKCPNCQRKITQYFITSDKPMCEFCNIWFEILENGWVLRNTNAKEEYKKEAKNVEFTI